MTYKFACTDFAKGLNLLCEEVKSMVGSVWSLHDGSAKVRSNVWVLADSFEVAERV